MQCLDTIAIRHSGTIRRVMLYHGDLSRIPAHEAVDLLVVSAYPNSYHPSRGTLIAALARQGVWVVALAENKAVDLRDFASCWLSQPITTPGMNFHRLLCYEPLIRGDPVELVGDIFRSIIPFTTGEQPIRSLAMPLVASGNQQEDPRAIFDATVRAAVQWLETGMPVDAIKITVYPPDWLEWARPRFAELRQQLAPHPIETRINQPIFEPEPTYRYDAFVSHSSHNEREADLLVSALLAERPGLRLFVDHTNLQTGQAWHNHIFDMLDDCRKIVCLLSPAYLESRICKDEFNIALYRHRETPSGVLLPVYIYSAKLPTYMKLMHYIDAREGDAIKLACAARPLLAQM